MIGKTDFVFLVCCTMFLKYLKRNNYSLETINGYEKDLNFFQKFMNLDSHKIDFSMMDVRKRDLLKFMDYGREQGHKTNSIARRILTIKSFYKFLVYELDYPFDVAASIRVPKAYVPLPDILSESDVKRLLCRAGEMSRLYELLFSTLYYTGSRLTPVRTLQVKHVTLHDSVIYFPKVKGGKDLYLPIHDDLKALFEVYFSTYLSEKSKFVFASNRIPNQPVSPATVRNKLRIAAVEAGIHTRITPHILRHCTATHLTINNVEQRKIASILGHADLRSTMRYQHLSVDHLRGPVNSL